MSDAAIQTKLTKLQELIGDLAFDYDRLSSSGQEVFDEIETLLNEMMKSS